MWSQLTNVTDRHTDRQTDDMQSQYRAMHYSASRGKNCADTDIDEVGVDVVRTVDASDWLQTDAR